MGRLMQGMVPWMGGTPSPPGQSAEAPEAPAAPAMTLNRMLNPWLFAGDGAAAPPPADPAAAPPSSGAPPGAGTLPWLGGIPGFGGFPGFPGYTAPPEPPPTPPPTTPPPAAAPPMVLEALPFPFFIPPLQLLPQVKTATQLARSAISTLDAASGDLLNDAINTLKGRGIPGPELLDFLERRVRIGEVLNQMSSTWGQTTGNDFAEAFQMDAGRRDVMDAIVAIAILSGPDIDEEILVENTPRTQEQDLLDNRVIVDQWPKGGTAMQPPYMILVAVEYRDVAQAQDIVRSITDQLAEHEGYKLTRNAIGRLRSG